MGDFKAPPARREDVYRFFNEEQLARRFVEGHIRLSTIDLLRQSDERWGDPDEATAQWVPPPLHGGLPEAEQQHLREQLKRGGINVGPGNEVIDCRVEFQHVNQFVISTTTDAKLKHFGPYGVRIFDLQGFLDAVGYRLASCVRADVVAAFAPFRYAPRIHTGSEAPVYPSLLGPKGNEVEREIRFNWRVEGDYQYPPFLDLCVPELSRVCCLA